ncbi:hypothetical protein M405DRAFT_938067 [Rhizopogon salebrosus TDB-379]|nr:hypothetical protein M405DRAFT_938067 [Rhizopogon salebrosus TDB-379]
MSDVIVDNSPDWWPTLQALQLANCCSIAAVALVWYDYSLLFMREINHVWSLGTMVTHVEPIRCGSLSWHNTCNELFYFSYRPIMLSNSKRSPSLIVFSQCEYTHGTLNVCSSSYNVADLTTPEKRCL